MHIFLERWWTLQIKEFTPAVFLSRMSRSFLCFIWTANVWSASQTISGHVPLTRPHGLNTHLLAISFVTSPYYISFQFLLRLRYCDIGRSSHNYVSSMLFKIALASLSNQIQVITSFFHIFYWIPFHFQLFFIYHLTLKYSRYNYLKMYVYNVSILTSKINH